MITADELPSTPAESILRKYSPLINGLIAAASIVGTWYISTTVSAGELKAQVTKNTEEIREIKSSMQNLLTKEVYEAREKGNTDRAERMEKMILEILKESRK